MPIKALRQVAVGLMLVCGVVTSLGACSNIDKPKPSCEQAIAAVEPAVGSQGGAADENGNDLPIIPIGLAETTDLCESLAQWTDALQAHPEVVSRPSIEADDLVIYVYGACIRYFQDTERVNAVCDEARTKYGLDFG